MRSKKLEAEYEKWFEENQDFIDKHVDYLLQDYDDWFLGDIVDKINDFPKKRDTRCHNCKHKWTVNPLIIHAYCPKCKKENRQRGWGSIGTEIEDVFDAVLNWEYERKKNIKKSWFQKTKEKLFGVK